MCAILILLHALPRIPEEFKRIQSQEQGVPVAHTKSQGKFNKSQFEAVKRLYQEISQRESSREATSDLDSSTVSTSQLSRIVLDEEDELLKC